MNHSDYKWIIDQVDTIIHAVVMEDYRTAEDSIEKVVKKHGQVGGYAILYGLSGAVVKATRMVEHRTEHTREHPGAFFGFQVIRDSDGATIEPEDMPPEATGIIRAVRLITACANEDYDAMVSIMDTITTEEQAHETLDALVNYVQAVSRHT
jgi:hypothetical protein